MPNNRAPQRFLRRADAVAAVIGRRRVVQFHRLLVRAATGVLVARILTPGINNRLQGSSGVNVAVFADAEKQDAVNDALAGFGELVVFQQFVVVVVFENVGGEIAPGFVEEFQKVGVESAVAVWLDEPLLAGLAGRSEEHTSEL